MIIDIPYSLAPMDAADRLRRNSLVKTPGLEARARSLYIRTMAKIAAVEARANNQAKDGRAMK